MNRKRHIFLVLALLLIFIPISWFLFSRIIESNAERYANPLEKNLKAEWYREAFTLIRTRYTRVKIAIVYHEKWQNDDGSWSDLRIDSSPGALQAYREGISSSYFIGKEGLVVSDGVIIPPENGCYVGVFPGWGEYEDSVDSDVLIDFERLSGKSVAFTPFSIFWGQNYISRDNLDEISSYGAIPLLRLMPWGEPYWESGYQPEYSLQKIIDGEFDTFLSSWADVVREYGKPVMVTFACEMNGDWFPWSGVFQGGGETRGYGDPQKPDGPERYVNAFRHIVTLFRNKGADNAIWYFQPNHISYPDEDWNSIDAYYPGDNYVDWIGLSVYGAQTKNDEWITFEEAMEPAYNLLTSKFPEKPIMLCEWGVVEYEDTGGIFHSAVLSINFWSWPRILVYRWDGEDLSFRLDGEYKSSLLHWIIPSNTSTYLEA